MAKAKKTNTVKPAEPAAVEKKINREELMKQPGWSNTLPGSPAATRKTL